MKPLHCSRVWAEIDLDALSANYRALCRHVFPKEVMCVVKADAYGMGAEAFVRRLWNEGCRHFGVATPVEALEIVSLFGDIAEKPVVQILSSILPCEIDAMVESGVVLPVVDYASARLMSKAACKYGVAAKVHFKVDTGMGRLGVAVSEALSLLKKVKRLPNIDVEGAFTHFSSASRLRSGTLYTKRQVSAFKDFLVAAGKEGISFSHIHSAASDAIRYFPESYNGIFTMVRAGLSLHGNFDGDDRSSIALCSVMTLKTRVVQVRSLPRGMHIGYCRTCTLGKDSKIAIIAAGYADGLPLAISNKGFVIVSGVLCPILGRVSMDCAAVDVSAARRVAVGDEVVLIGSFRGKAINAAHWAKLKKTHVYDIFCSLGDRVSRIYCSKGVGCQTPQKA